MLGFNPGLLRLWHWQSYSLTILCLISSPVQYIYRARVRQKTSKTGSRATRVSVTMETDNVNGVLNYKTMNQERVGQWWVSFGPFQTVKVDIYVGLLHCKENPIYVFLCWELRGLSPNFHIHFSVIDLYIPRIGSHISLQQNRQTDPGIYKSLTDIWV